MSDYIISHRSRIYKSSFSIFNYFCHQKTGMDTLENIEETKHFNESEHPQCKYYEYTNTYRRTCNKIMYPQTTQRLRKYYRCTTLSSKSFWNRCYK